MSLHFIQFEGVELEYELIRKDVKYINLRVNKKGEVVVSAPEKAPFSVIEEFVASKTFWIITHLAEIEKIKQQMPAVGMYEGKTLYYLGKAYALALETGEKKVEICGETIRLTSPEAEESRLREIYLSWLKERATETFSRILDKLYPLVEEYQIKKPAIQVRNMKTLWGSCTPGGEAIRLNLQLMKGDEACMEQVILHELLHFRYPNHGKAFYALLTELMPDWKERKSRLETKYKDGV